MRSGGVSLSESLFLRALMSSLMLCTEINGASGVSVSESEFESESESESESEAELESESEFEGDEVLYLCSLRSLRRCLRIRL